MKHPSEWEGPRGKDAAAPLNALSVRLARAVLGALAWIVFMETVGRLVRRYCHFPVPACAARFLDSPWRRALQPPEALIAQAGVRPGMTVLELGPGPGAFTIEAARRALPGGRVVAVDV